MHPAGTGGTVCTVLLHATAAWSGCTLLVSRPLDKLRYALEYDEYMMVDMWYESEWIHDMFE